MTRKRIVFPSIAFTLAALSGCGGGGDFTTIAGIETQAGDVAATNLFHAAELGDLPALQEFVTQGQALTNRHAENQRTALHYAAWGGHTNVVAWLLEQKADIDALDDEGQAPLDFAWMPRSEAAKAMLLSAGAKPGKELRPPEPEPVDVTGTPEKEEPGTEPVNAKP